MYHAIPGRDAERGDRAQIGRAGRQRGARQGQQERRLDERRDRDLAAAAHPAERAARRRAPTRARTNRPRASSPTTTSRSPQPSSGGRTADDRDEERGDEHGRKDDRRSGRGQRARRVALDGLLVPPLREVAVRLQDRRPAPVLEARLDPLRDPEQERRDEQREHDLDQRPGRPVVSAVWSIISGRTRSSTTSATTDVGEVELEAARLEAADELRGADGRRDGAGR